METIGLNIGEMTNLLISLKAKLTKDQEGNVQANTTRFIDDGCTEDEAGFMAKVIGIQSVDTSAIIGIIIENNNRILSDLKNAGLLKP